MLPDRHAHSKTATTNRAAVTRIHVAIIEPPPSPSASCGTARPQVHGHEDRSKSSGAKQDRQQGQVSGTTGSANGLGREAGSQVVNRHRFHRKSSCGDAVSRW